MKHIIFDDLINLITSGKPTYWTHSNKNHLSVWAYKNDVNLRIEEEESDGEFKEPWAIKHPDPAAFRFPCNIYYNASLIKNVLLVSVDMERGIVPKPKTPLSKEVDWLEYKVAEIVDRHLVEYMMRSGLSAKDPKILTPEEIRRKDHEYEEANKRLNGHLNNYDPLADHYYDPFANNN